jgi:hypothetical protein
MEKPKHVCKLKKLKYKSGNTIFFCTLPDCNRKISVGLALGKRCICWRCGEPFILSEYSLRLAKPHCSACHKPKDESPEPSKNQIHAEEQHEADKYGLPEIEITLAEKLEQIIQNAQKETQEVEEDI